MKRIFVLTIIALVQCEVSMQGQVISVKADFSTVFPSVYKEKTKVVKGFGGYSLVYLDSLGSTSICVTPDFNYSYFIGSSLDKRQIPYNSTISDLYKNFYIWFGGKYGLTGEGMYGWIIPTVYPTIQQFHMFYLSEIDEVKEIAVANIGNTPPILRMFAIGATEPNRNRHIMELDVVVPGVSPTSPYQYATVNAGEYLDKIAIVDDYVVYTTRVINNGCTSANLRVMTTVNGLSDPLIDNRWQILQSPDETICGKVFVTYLEDRYFEVCYIKYLHDLNKYVLCLNRIKLDEMLIGVNTSTISQEIQVGSEESIQDIVYDPHEHVMVLLLEKEGDRSVFLHTEPNLTVNYYAVRLESAINECYYSIDTMATYTYNPARMYQAWGGTKCFEQRFATVGTISESCIPYEKINVKSVDPIKTNGIDDELPREVGKRNIWGQDQETEHFIFQSNCFLDEQSK